ncbi:EAL domain-containing protein [Marinimicrobium sp. ABcell2]|uniref:EAL domain-containing protein n=1 Tax=Marinimicrobium sp. ABcell2 TaxID=3069751 RepID=UPI0027B29DA7|nr:EAL domain-containing protein [Marinimicrobium sp. ABcell2]MDQ2078099.1 EAL domain-containing protein [Marinimicrobium sp. ABcell2]
MHPSAVNILAIDDDAFMLKVLEKALGEQGFTSVVSCLGGRQALEWFDAQPKPPAVVVLDLKMPEMDGIEFLRHLVERKFQGHLLLISGQDEAMLRSAEKLVKAHNMEILGYLHKPVKPGLLAELLGKLPNLSGPLAKNAVRHYEPARLREAIAKGELVNYYQPIVSVKTGQPESVEALVRWEHPDDGLVPPDVFIGLAEENDLIDALAEAVIDMAIAQIKVWRSQGIKLPVGINLSMENLSKVEFADTFSSKVEAAGLSPGQFILEVTESRAMRDPAATLDNLTRLRLKGFVLAIDDFGTGYSSLAHLRDLPFNKFKLDRTFVHNAWSEGRVRSMFDTSLNLAKDLDLQVIAEGVETQEDWVFIRTTRCDQAQGYLIAKPMPADDIAPWLKVWNQRLRRELVPESGGAIASGEGAQQTVLIVEDNELQRKVQNRILSAENFRVVTASNGREALEILRTLRPDLIFIDIEMPGMSGLDVLRQLRKTRVFAKTPVVIVSGINTKNVVKNSLEAGANSFMVKPFDRKTLVERARQALTQVD